MKYVFMVCLISSAVVSAASDSPKNYPSVRRSSQKKSSRSEIKASDSPQGSPVKDRRKLMETVSDLSPETKNLREKNPHVLPLGSTRITRSRSLSGEPNVNLTAIASLNLLPEECGEMVRHNDGVVSPRSFPTSPRAGLQRVASHRTMELVLEREEQKMKLEQYKSNLSQVEQRLFDAVNFVNFEFIKKRPSLLAHLIKLPKDQIISNYMAYLRSSNEKYCEKIIQQDERIEKLKGLAGRCSIPLQNESPRSASPRDDSPRTVDGLILAAQTDERYSPRRTDAPESLEEVAELISHALKKTNEEMNRVLYSPTSPEHIESLTGPIRNRTSSVSASSSLASSSSSTP